MSLTLTKKDAINWLLNHLEVEFRVGGCHAYQGNPKTGCELCKVKLATLTEVKKVLGVK